MSEATPLLVARGLVYRYPGAGGRPALDGVDLEVSEGEGVAVVGESGSGKSTLARCLVRLLEPERGELRFAGENLLALRRRELAERRSGFQIVFQDPAEAFDPRLRIGFQVGEPLLARRLADRETVRRRVEETLAAVRLDPSLAERFPHALSGGERQRAAIARALVPGPRLLVLDEPVSAIDPALRSEILDLLAELRRRLRLATVTVTHDLAAVDRVAERVSVLFAGRVVESGPISTVLLRPRHPYTRELRLAVPVPDPSRRGRRRSREAVEEPATEGCAYHRRCPWVSERCRRETPRLGLVEGGDGAQAVACHHPVGEALGSGESL